MPSLREDDLFKRAASDKKVEGGMLLPVQVQVQCPEENPKRLSWGEMEQIIKRSYKRKQWRKASKRYQTFHPKRVKRQQEKYSLKKNMKKQKEHPEKILAKREFWVVKR